MSKEKECKCCHEWWYSSDIKDDLCPNCYYYFKQIKQQLEKKDKLLKCYQHEEKQIAKMLGDEDLTLIGSRSVLKNKLEEKDKEIERLKQELEETNAGYDFTYEQSTETIKELQQNQKQLAITELEKVKDTLKHFYNIHSDEYYGVKTEVKGIELDVCESIDYQIKELKGEQT